MRQFGVKMVITKQSSCEDVISFLQENNLDDLVEEFQGMLTILIDRYIRMNDDGDMFV